MLDKEKTIEALNTYCTATTGHELKLVEREGSLYLECEVAKRSNVFQKLFLSDMLDVKEAAQFCVTHNIANFELEQAIRKHNASCFLFGKIPFALILKLQVTRLQETPNCPEAVHQVLSFLLGSVQNKPQDEAFAISLNEAIKHDANSIITLLLRRDLVPINWQQKSGPQKDWTSLMYAVEAADSKTCEELLQHGAKVDMGPFTFTPLMLACQKGYGEICRVLLDAGADQTIRNVKDKKTAYEYASSQTIRDIVQQKRQGDA